MISNLPNVPYRGLRNLKLRTYTNTYPFIEGTWNFEANTNQPMEFQGYVSGGLPVGFQGNIFDLQTGITNFSFGQMIGSPSSDFGNVVYNGGRLYGFCFGSAGPRICYTFNQGITLGQNISQPVLNLSEGFTVSQTATNTQIPNPLIGSNFILTDGLFCSSSENIGPFTRFYDYKTGLVGARQPVLATFSPTDTFDLAMPFGGLDYIWKNIHTLLPGNRLLVTNWPAPGVLYSTQFENPPNSNIDINAIINSDQQPLYITYGGWLYLYKDAVIIEGVSCVGYGVLIQPDYSSYELIRFIPVDAQAFTWTTLIGAAEGKIDQSGALWIHIQNHPSILFITAGSIGRLLPVFPPVTIPPPIPDTEIPITPYRESGAGS